MIIPMPMFQIRKRRMHLTRRCSGWTENLRLQRGGPPEVA